MEQDQIVKKYFTDRKKNKTRIDIFVFVVFLLIFYKQ